MSTLGALPVAALLFSCQPATDDAAIEEHEKIEAEASAQLAGWLIERAATESAHPLGHNLKETIEIVGPETARKLRLRFRSIRMERDYDYLVIQDESGTELERITGNHNNYLSRTIDGRKAKIVLETDGSVASPGFVLDQIRHRGCTRNVPGDLALAPASSCTELRDAIRKLAVAEVRKRFTFGYYGRRVPLRNAEAEGGNKTLAHSETNVQVAGVDEPDIVKTDGQHVYAVAGHELRIFKAWPADQSALEHRVPIEGWPRELFVEGTRIVVLSGVMGDSPIGPMPRPGLVKMMPPWWRADAFTKVTVIDFATGTPRVAHELLLSGQYNTARRTGTTLRLVLNRELRWPELRYWPEGVDASTREFEKAMDDLEAEAVQTVERRVLADWLPPSYRVINGRRELLPTTCEDFMLPTGSDELGLSSVVTVNLGGAAPTIQDTSLLVRAATIYQSLDNLFFSANHNWSCWEDAGTEGQFSYVHQLDARDPLRTRYRASGGVPGAIANQFAMDEHDGVLRVATTNTRWSAPTPADQTSNQVFVLERSGRRLEVVGQTPPLAPGERIFSTRFVKDTGYVVTFRQVDPLFVIDLARPRAPRVVGELKIPGFSTYLHVLDADHLFTIGQDFEEDGTTRNGVALSIFDVSDKTRPRLAHKSLIGTTHGHSEALYEHKAFTMYRAPGATDAVLAIPFTDWVQPVGDAAYWSGFTSSLKVFQVSAGGIAALGEVDLSDLFERNQESGWGWWYVPNVRRGVFVEGNVYAVSDAGLKVAEIFRPGNVVARVPAPAQQEEPTPEPAVITAEAGAAPDAAIPDNDPKGVESTVTVDHELSISTLTVDVKITHSYRGDLQVALEHAGVTEILHDRTGGSQDDLSRSFTTERFAGLSAAGDWTLRVVDAARVDVGRLVEWRVIAVGKAGSGTTPTPVTRSFSASPRGTIPDNDNRGFVSEIEVPDGIDLTALVVGVDITHSYRGDLVVTLEHDGVSAVIHDRAGGSFDDLHLEAAVDRFVGRDARGTWRLRVSDTAAADTGRLDAWRLELRGNLR
ncbi:MAG: beta-propeller domain-containing protein [Deltaproteobacteria bacterium]|nr:beta-propeller domain-containing protein [Deltaproteobacteria bacterium]